MLSKFIFQGPRLNLSCSSPLKLSLAFSAYKTQFIAERLRIKFISKIDRSSARAAAFYSKISTRDDVMSHMTSNLRNMQKESGINQSALSNFCDVAESPTSQNPRRRRSPTSQIPDVADPRRRRIPDAADPRRRRILSQISKVAIADNLRLSQRTPSCRKTYLRQPWIIPDSRRSYLRQPRQIRDNLRHDRKLSTLIAKDLQLSQNTFATAVE